MSDSSESKGGRWGLALCRHEDFVLQSCSGRCLRSLGFARHSRLCKKKAAELLNTARSHAQKSSFAQLELDLLAPWEFAHPRKLFKAEPLELPSRMRRNADPDFLTATL